MSHGFGHYVIQSACEFVERSRHVCACIPEGIQMFKHCGYGMWCSQNHSYICNLCYIKQDRLCLQFKNVCHCVDTVRACTFWSKRGLKIPLCQYILNVAPPYITPCTLSVLPLFMNMKIATCVRMNQTKITTHWFVHDKQILLLLFSLLSKLIFCSFFFFFCCVHLMFTTN